MVNRKGAPDHPGVMVSSTYLDLEEHREAVVEALLRVGFFPIGMEFDSAKADKDVIDSSLDMVAKARAYVGIISHLYGGVPKDSTRNPKKLSITELEYHRAVKLGIPVFMFVMSDDHPVKARGVETVSAYRKKLEAFKDEVRSRSIYAEFSSVEELASRVIQSMSEFRKDLASSAQETEQSQDQPRGKAKLDIPSPPKLLAVPGFVSGHKFVGRREELAGIDEWATGGDSIMIIEAIGGAGKSTLAWQWLEERAAGTRPDFAGAIWYSFYEGGANTAEFAAYALTYITGEPLKEFLGRKTADLARLLIAVLREHPFLLVLDGLERVLVAYHRLDASQARDDQVSSDKTDCACTRPSDGDLLRQLIAAAPSKILITSRLMPAALTNWTRQALPGVRHLYLGGLHSDDALKMMRDIGVRGDDSTIRHYLKDNFDNHPLMLGIVAGLVNDYFREPGDFDRWADDPQGGASLDLAKLDLSQRRTHILAAALNGLEPGVRQLLSRIAAFGQAVSSQTLEALNPFLPLSQNMPEESEGFRQATPKLVSALQDLQRRGLLQWDRKENVYDLHPVVRGYAFDILEQPDREDICNRIVDHFQSKPGDRYADAKTIADVQQSISIFRLLVQARRFDDAALFYKGDFSRALIYSVERYQEILALLKPLFPSGFQKPPSSITNRFNQVYLLQDAGIALRGLSRFSEGRGAFEASLKLNLEAGDELNTITSLHSIAIAYFGEGRISSSFAILKLAFDLSGYHWDSTHKSVTHRFSMLICRQTGRFEQAEASYKAFRSLPTPTLRNLYRPGEIEREYCWLRFYQGALTERDLDEAETIGQDGGTKTLRSLAELRGELALQRRDISSAITGFERAIEMTHIVGLPAGKLEARLALAKAIAGDREHAREICDRLCESEQPPDVELASAYLEIGENAKALEHVLKGYRWAWAEGPSYSRWWELEQCRAVLKTLGEPEPNLPAFDPTAVEPLPYEEDVRKLIEKLKSGR